MPSYAAGSSVGDIISMPSVTNSTDVLAQNNSSTQSGSVAVPYEVTLPEIVVTPSGSSVSMAGDIMSASMTGDTLAESHSQTASLDTASSMSATSAASNISDTLSQGDIVLTQNAARNVALNATSNSPVWMPSYAAGSSVGDTISMPSMSDSLSDATMLDNTDSSQGDTFSSSMQQSVSTSGRSITVDRVCEQIVINVQNTDGQGVDEIRSRILEVLNEIVEG